MLASAASASSSSPLSACRCSPARWRSSSLRKAAPARAQRRHHARRFQPPRQDAGRAIRPCERHLPDARARQLALCRGGALRHRSRRLIRDCSSSPFRRAKRPAPLRRPLMAEGDHLLLRGDAEAAAAFAAKMHLAFREDAAAGQGEETLFNRRSGLAEVVIPPRSGLIGETVFPGMVTESGDLDHPGGPARRHARLPTAAADQGRRRDRAAGRRHDAAAGNVESPRRPSRRSRCPGRELARAGPPPGRADGAGRAPGHRHSARDGPAARHRHRPARGRRPVWPPARSSCRAS